MSNADDFYSSSRPSSTAYTTQPIPNTTPYENDYPPPPPPKPSSHDTSRRGTPSLQQQSGPPLPPTPTQSSRYSPPIPGSPSTRPGTQPPPSYQQQTQFQDPDPRILPPQISDNWLPPTLLEKQTSDLATTLQNGSLLHALSTTHPSYPSSLAPLTNHLAQTTSLSQHVLETAAHLSKVREETQKLLLQHTQLSAQWRRKQSEMDKALEPWSPKAMYQRLVASISEQESIVGAMEESFLEGGTTNSNEEDFYGSGGGGGGKGGQASEREVNEWVKRVREGVQTLEMRKEMRGRWDEGRVGGWR